MRERTAVPTEPRGDGRRAALPAWVAWVVVGAGTAATGTYALAPHSVVGGLAFVLVALAVPVGMVIGIGRNRPARARPWTLIAAAAVTSAIGTALRAQAQGAGLDAGLVLGHVITLASYGLIGAGLVGMLRARHRGAVDAAALIDGSLVAVSAWVMVWSFFVLPATADGADLGVQLLEGTYPTASMVIAYLSIRLALQQGHRVPALRLLTLGLTTVLAGDLAYASVDAGYLRADTAVLDAAYAFAFLCAAGAVLHPTMRVLTEPGVARERSLGAGRLAAVSTGLLAPVVAAAMRPPVALLEWVMLLGSAVVAMGLVVLRISRAVGEHVASEARLSRQANEDALTGLANRGRVLDHLDAVLLEDGHDGVAVLFVDLDRFKDVNDTWGHPVGDQLLVAVGRRLATQLRPTDVLARLGGDEFVVVATPIADPQAALSLAARLVAELEDDVDLGLCTVEVAASIGVAHADASRTGGAEDLLRDADTAMYRAKDDGGDAIVVFDASMRADVARRVDLEAALRHAVVRDELRLHYQPVVDLSTGILVGFEALVRWERSGHGLVPPLDFIPVAESTGAIVGIGAWVLQEGCRQLAEWDATLGLDGHLTMAVNVSARQLRDDGVLAVVMAALATHGIASRRLVVEITESVMVGDVAGAQGSLGALRALGIHLAADDFGTGYSSLSYLKQYPIDHVKIDRSFVAGLGTDADDDGIVTAILAMARALDLVVVAEGIETTLQRRRLTELGCDHAQGYLFARPLTAAAAGALLEAVRAGRTPWAAEAGGGGPTGRAGAGRSEPDGHAAAPRRDVGVMAANGSPERRAD
jgi:diguanylate cyclase (GGDEF)-like protein